MIRELFKLDLIEQKGEPEKKPEKRNDQIQGQKLFGEEVQHGTKRKAENPIDQNGNWNRGKKDAVF